MTEPKDMIIPMLKEMRAESSSLFTELEKSFDQADKRLEAIDQAQQDGLRTLAARNRRFSEYFKPGYRSELGFEQ